MDINITELATKWRTLQDIPNVFAYRLDILERKYLPGELKFYAELNPDRITLRRPPQTIETLDPPFEEEKFNFKKIKPLECLMKIPHGDKKDDTVSLILNKSPLTLFHTLICPSVKKNLNQRITLEALVFCTDFLLSIENNEHFRIGYNSPGALASVNHLHLHLVYLEKELYIDQAEISMYVRPHICRLSSNMPTEAVCFLINPTDSASRRRQKLLGLYELLLWLCEQNIPHNLFMTPVRMNYKETAWQPKCLRIFVFARENYCIIRDLNALNIGFCEMAGYVSVGSKELYDNLSEELLLETIRKETGNVYKKIENFFLEECGTI